LDNGRIVSFPFPVIQTIECADVLVVRLDVPPGARFNENVFGVDREGKIAWQVPQRPNVYADSPYTGMEHQNDRVVLSNWDGLQLTIACKTGQVLAEGEGR
jgi:hypothetical protein